MIIHILSKEHMVIERTKSDLSSTYEHFKMSYIGTMLWSSSDSDDGEPLDSQYDESDISESTLAEIDKDCGKFWTENWDLINCEGAPMSTEDSGASDSENVAAMAGHDFWLTRCGHGAGFWDGNWPEPQATKLTEASEKFGNTDPYIGDDGLIYLG